MSTLANTFGIAIVDLGLTAHGTPFGQEVCIVLNDPLDLIQVEAWWKVFVDEKMV